MERYSLVRAFLLYTKANHTPLCELISTHFIRLLMILLSSTRFLTLFTLLYLPPSKAKSNSKRLTISDKVTNSGMKLKNQEIKFLLEF